VSFDSVPQALFVLLRTITYDDWTVPMYKLMASLPTYVPTIYFAIILVFGGMRRDSDPNAAHRLGGGGGAQRVSVETIRRHSALPLTRWLSDATGRLAGCLW
jgi:hypothetical protein